MGGVKKAGLRVKLLGITVAALLERRLLLVRVLGAEVRRIGRSLLESEPSSSDCVSGRDEGEEGLSGLWVGARIALLSPDGPARVRYEGKSWTSARLLPSGDVGKDELYSTCTLCSTPLRHLPVWTSGTPALIPPSLVLSRRGPAGRSAPTVSAKTKWGFS